MNITLCQDIQKEFISGPNSTRIQEAVMREPKGEIEIFVRYGRHQKTSPPPLNLLEEPVYRGLRYSAYKEMVQTIVNALKKLGRDIVYGHLIIRYEADEEGMIKALHLLYKEVFQHNKQQGKNTK